MKWSPKKIKKIKITQAGQPCRHCGTPVERRESRYGRPKKGSDYYYAWFFMCPNKTCKAMYMVDEAKRTVSASTATLDESVFTTPAEIVFDIDVIPTELIFDIDKPGTGETCLTCGLPAVNGKCSDVPW